MDDNLAFILIICAIIFLLFLIMYKRYEENFEPVQDASSNMMNSFEIFRQQLNIPAMQVNVMQNGKKTYGGNHSAKNVPIWDFNVDITVKDNTLFRIASVSKPITAIGILYLVDKGMLQLDDKMINILIKGNIVDESTIYDKKMYEITIRDLLRHSGGWDNTLGLDLSVPFAKNIFPERIRNNFLTDFDPQYDALKLATPDKNRAANAVDLIRFMMRFPLNFAPGTREKYSNFGYNILGRIIEVISGDPYDVFIKNNIFAPAGFEYPAFIGNELIENKHPDEVYYYDGPDGRLEYPANPNITYRTPLSYGPFTLNVMDSHGGWVMTATDLSKVGSRMLNLGYFSQVIFDEILQRPSYIDPNATTFYSLGMYVTNMPDGDIMLSHRGGLTYGTFGFIGMMIKKNLVFSIIANHLEFNNPNFTDLLNRLINNLFANANIQ